MILSADKNKYSPPEWNVVKDLKSPIPIVLVTRLDNFQFNEELLKLDKYVLVDMCELGWNFPIEKTGSHKWGQQYKHFDFGFNGEEWNKFNEWVSSNEPLLTFQRELLKKDVTETLLPIDYPYYGEIPAIQTKEEYYSRPLNVFHYWGRSSEHRVKAHADVWLASSKSGATICDNIYYLQDFIAKEENPNKWVSLHIPHYLRHNIGEILYFNGLSKLSLSLPGCGKKCFRSAEVSINSVMLQEGNDLAWQFPWHVGNCLFYYDNDPVKWAEIELSHTGDFLYNTYCAGVENARNYQIDNYTVHISKIINSFL